MSFLCLRQVSSGLVHAGTKLYPICTRLLRPAKHASVRSPRNSGLLIPYPAAFSAVLLFNDYLIKTERSQQQLASWLASTFDGIQSSGLLVHFEQLAVI